MEIEIDPNVFLQHHCWVELQSHANVENIISNNSNRQVLPLRKMKSQTFLNPSCHMIYIVAVHCQLSILQRKHGDLPFLVRCIKKLIIFFHRTWTFRTWCYLKAELKQLPWSAEAYIWFSSMWRGWEPKVPPLWQMKEEKGDISTRICYLQYVSTLYELTGTSFWTSCSFSPETRCDTVFPPSQRSRLWVQRTPWSCPESPHRRRTCCPAAQIHKCSLHSTSQV